MDDRLVVLSRMQLVEVPLQVRGHSVCLVEVIDDVSWEYEFIVDAI